MEQYTGKLVSLDLRPARSTLRAFGLALALLCIARAVWSWFIAPGWHAPNMIPAALGVAALSLALIQPGLLRPLHILLGVLSYPVRWLVAFTAIATLYFGVITPIACILRLTRRVSGQTSSFQTETQGRSAWRVSAARGDKPSYFRQF